MAFVETVQDIGAAESIAEEAREAIGSYCMDACGAYCCRFGSLRLAGSEV